VLGSVVEREERQNVAVASEPMQSMARVSLLNVRARICEGLQGLFCIDVSRNELLDAR